ncbi:MAG: FAD-binding oxidoreductase [Actinomycetes bacterium]
MSPSGQPTPPIAIAGEPAEVTGHLAATRVGIAPEQIDALLATGATVSTIDGEIVEASRDWWPLAMIWALDGEVAARAAAIVRPADAAQVAAVLQVCDAAGIPVTAAGGRSGVCGASVPVHGGVLLDMTALDGIVEVDLDSMLVRVLPGTFGTWFEETLRTEHGVTAGHWPQSIDLSTVGGWIACRGAGQYSTRYGKIEDIVAGLEVALADGRVIRTGGAPRAAVGPDLTQLFVGSEGTLGIVTEVTLRLHPAPATEQRAAYSFATFADGLEVCRRIMRRGARPAVLRHYDEIEGDRSYKTGDRQVLLVMDEGDPAIVEATMQVVDEEARACGGDTLDVALVEQWMGHRNDVSALEALITRGYVVDTMEISAPWGACADIYAAATAAIRGVEGTMVASAHQSHSYPDGACLYFTFAGNPPTEGREAYYRAAWDAGQRAVLANGGALSHHHGVGLNRSRFIEEALGAAHGVLVDVKRALDPNGILNPGKLGLPDPWGGPAWP